MSLVILNKAVAALLACCAGALLLACDRPEPMDPQVDPQEREQSRANTAVPAAATVKPSAPIAVDYEILSTPLVEQRTELQLRIESSLEGPVYLSYQLKDSGALTVDQPESERSRVAMERANGRMVGSQRLAVTPHREGSYSLTVITEIETENGPLTSSTSIPIEVAGLGANLQSKQQRQAPTLPASEDAEGEAIISMPAQENN